MHLVSGTILLFYEFISTILITKTIIGIKKALHLSSYFCSREMRLLTVTIISSLLSVCELIYEFSYLPAIENSENRLLEWILNQFENYFLLFLTMNAYSILLLSKAVQHDIAQR
ncbi:hypothetical protein KIN20_006601 [Parelaphostrongylus tenuis]|uniref:Uncharacterized protein n=1 Tax=Parelaphostrongylus tenuis TaxID=148309 RepID=A0AAD5M202_PARTN|nr:hypothetical protein KIN20_006601 [Parelaphostrongylus tenuis]